MSELAWRQAPPGPGPGSRTNKIGVARWRSLDDVTTEMQATTDASTHVIAIALRRMDVRLTMDGRTLVDGVVLPGTLNMAAPGAPVRCLFRGPCDTLHLHVPRALAADCAIDLQGQGAPALHSWVSPSPDPIMERLGMAMLGAAQSDGSFGPLYADSLGMAIMVRLMASFAKRGVIERPRRAPLEARRLNRAKDYVEANLAEPITLADMAAAAGQTRMHFAAQFRAATGLRPHDYLLRRRIERAQAMLAGSAMPVIAVALEVGFQSQAHFTSVFKRYAGLPPHAWRRGQGGAA